MNIHAIYSSSKTEHGKLPLQTFNYQLSFTKINNKNVRYFLNRYVLYTTVQEVTHGYCYSAHLSFFYTTM